MRKPLKGTIFSALILLSIIILNTGCSKTPISSTGVNVSDVVTLNVISTVTNTTAISGGIVTNGGGGTITTNGVCYSSTNQTPTITDSKTTDTVGVNGFTSRLTGLTPSTTYYLRAYASNAAGIGYGNVIKFTTGATAAIPTATVTTIAGSTAGNYGFMDGTGLSALFNGPQAISYNPVTGKLYIADTFNNLIRTMTTAGVVSTLTQPTLGLVNGPLSVAQFYGPANVAFDAQGNAYVSDLGNNVIRKITAAGVVSTLAGTGVAGYIDGAGNIAEFSSPEGITIDASGNLYVTDRGNNLIRKVTPAGFVTAISGAISATGTSQTSAPGFLDGTTGPTSLFNAPSSVAIDATGNLYVADLTNRAIRYVTVSTGAVLTYAGNPVQKYLIGAPVAITNDAAGDLFIVDEGGRILEITAAKTLYVLAGAANTAGYVDGPGATARFNTPQGIAIDAQGNLYVSDYNNNVIRKITVKIQ